MAKCPNCGAEIAVGQQFCGECGTKVHVHVDGDWNCINGSCRVHLANKEKFCPVCGKKTPNWYLNAAEHGDVEAMLVMGEIYCGYIGSPQQNQDFETAIEWFMKAAQNGSREGLWNLAYHTLRVKKEYNIALNIALDGLKKYGADLKLKEMFILVKCYKCMGDSQNALYWKNRFIETYNNADEKEKLHCGSEWAFLANYDTLDDSGVVNFSVSDNVFFL